MTCEPSSITDLIVVAMVLFLAPALTRQKTSLLSGRSQRSVGEAQQKVAQAMQSTSDPRGTQQSANALGDAADALNKAAASLARDRSHVRFAQPRC